MRLFLSMALALATVLIGACREAPDPERALRELLRNAEAAVEAKDLATLTGYISERYADAEGNDRRRIESLLRFWLLRHGAIHLVTRVQAVEFPSAGHARAVVLVAMAGERIADEIDWAGLRGDLYRFELAFAAAGSEWKLARAAWRPLEARDLF